MNIKPATMRRIEKRAYSRAADLAKTHAEHWEYVAAKQLRQRPAMTIGMQKPTGHWRILEKEIRALADAAVSFYPLARARGVLAGRGSSVLPTGG